MRKEKNAEKTKQKNADDIGSTTTSLVIRTQKNTKYKKEEKKVPRTSVVRTRVRCTERARGQKRQKPQPNGLTGKGRGTKKRNLIPVHA